MALTFIGIDPNTDYDHCPAVWVDTESKSDPHLVVQGWLADEATRAECSQNSPKPDTEAVIRIPARMAPLIREACDVAERAAAELR
ncbi:hypothetical protein AF335_03940 [Streptomyces eurocidicus]|uniref:Uncharacterized protein n=1 Tax=Streptomyces eurocidicus TaxID=66423 RepID=A0A2N8P3Y1_STREU|nr:hypothetical protein [Streptomyces eurocidicus]MBB5117677.1 hypothetical protein [Streptomyces eurocidicus]MBF6053514.1 hypothetical protein [Streptomyces eurocidicus]PNE35732.1 hypothetical protein AF335_03940 [Streptomyces eurocidicus]